MLFDQKSALHLFLHTVLFTQPVQTLYKKTGRTMNALLKSDINHDAHHWKLWVSPTANQQETLSGLSLEEKARILMMHPRDKQKMILSIEMAIESGLYEEICLPRSGLTQKEQGRLQLRAIRHSTIINWTDKAPRMNSASQLSLI